MTLPTHVCVPNEGDHPQRPLPTYEPLMPTGWPRPPSRDGLPVPFIASSLLDLGHVHDLRRRFVIESYRCQVCGDPLGDEAIVCARPDDEFVTDGAAIHVHPCWPVAIHRCPHLARLQARGDLDVWRVETSTLVIGETSAVHSFAGFPIGYRRPTTPPSPT